MINIKNNIIKNQENFWNNCLFHPTDAVEDPWGRRILDCMAEDKSINTVRIYTMFEDIVYLDENGKLQYDFRLSDLRLDYLVSKGYDLILAYAGIPDCIASDTNSQTMNAKNKTRYKGKMWNTCMPRDISQWEEICYRYTEHIVERYGEDVVATWHLQCFNEPDIAAFFFKGIPDTDYMPRVQAYGQLYAAFASGIQKVSEKLHFGGPAFAAILPFLREFLLYVKEHNLRLDFISLHNYAANNVTKMNNGGKFTVTDWITQYEKMYEIIRECGFADTEIVVDEWGMAAQGFYNVEECPAYIAREHEVFSAYYAKLIYKILEKGWKMSNLVICLSGQHEMVTDFSGFRNFFTLNFIRKPIYNAYVLASKLHKGLLSAKAENENVYVIPTKNAENQYAVLVSYSSEYFEEDLPEIQETLSFEEDLQGKTVRLWCIDKNTTNPYRVYEKEGMPEMTSELLNKLRKEGTLKPVREFVLDTANEIDVTLSANAVMLVEVL